MTEPPGGPLLAAGDWAASPPAHRVVLLTRAGCHLCDDARAVIERVCAELGESYEEHSILDDPDLQERYAEEIPVTLVDGRQHDFWRVDESRLRAALERATGR